MLKFHYIYITELKMNDEINSYPIKNKYYKHLWFLLIFPVYLIAFFVLESIITEDFPGMFLSHIPLDDKIPFCEYFVIFYSLWYPVLGLVGFYLIFRDARGFEKYMTYIGVTFFTMIIVCAVFPNYQDMRPAITGNENIFTKLLFGIYSADTDTNVLPSAHVLGAMAVVFAVFDCKSLNKKLWLKILAVIIGVLISISTVFVKQHSILDVFVAIPIGFAEWLLVYKVIFRNRTFFEKKVSKGHSARPLQSFGFSKKEKQAMPKRVYRSGRVLSDGRRKPPSWYF